MPRLNAAARPELARVSSRSRGKKAPPPQDRLSQRTLFLRRVRRSVKPGLWVLGAAVVLVAVSELIHALPHAAPVPQAAPASGGSGLAELGAAFGLRISKIEVLGAPPADQAAVAQAIGVSIGAPSFGFSLSGVRQRVEQVGAVQTAAVERELPGTLIVTVTERDAYAIWQVGGNGSPAKFVLIDKDGNVIANQDAVAAKRREPWLLLLTGPDAPEYAQSLITQLQAAPTVLSHVVAAQRVDGLRWNLVLKNQTVVKLPVSDAPDAIAQLGTLQASMQLLDRPVESIDLRMAGRLVVRPYPAPAPARDNHKSGELTHG
jgi:cell division protein FtsQ